MFRYKFLSMVILLGLLVSQAAPHAMAATLCDSAQFVSDLTIPDGTTVLPGTAFTKSWRLLNNGTCVWTASYNVVWMGGDQMSAPASVRLPVVVSPGQMVDISVNLIAPPTSGRYKGVFKLSNAEGVQFGIGEDSDGPFWVDINVVQVNAMIYDFVANAPYAQWKSGAGALPFPGASGDNRGYALQVNSPHLEDDSYDLSPALLTVPQNKLNGYIQATYPEFQIQSGDKLQTLVNCEFGATGCYATFRIDYILPNNTQKTLWSWKEAYDKRFYRANLDLSPLAGQKVRFVLMLLASGVASADRAMWGSPRIIRAGTIQPPAPPATLTPLPPLPATATPLSQPPPTVGSTGCDKASFVSDVTVPDGTTFSPGQVFTKTWRLKNAGSCVWTTSYKLIYFSGDQMNAPTAINLPLGATFGQTVDISVNMIAPSSAGSYRGYWIFANASGQYFGIGTSASKPIWVDIKVVGDAPYEGGYPLWSNACSAEWKSGSGPLPCPGVEGDSKGFIIPLNYSHLEDGTMGPLPSLLVAPENRYNGYIQGVFPTFTVQPGDHFVTGTGCEYGYSCYVSFRLDYMTSNGGVFNFWSWREQYDKKNNMANVDLTPLAGRSVRLILTILASGSASGDRVRWGGPTIVRVAGDTPPTITPLPTVTPPTSVIVPSPAIRDLRMIDSSNGWAIGDRYILRTMNGGATWYNVNPPNIVSVSNGFFQNSSKGWILATAFDTGTPPILFRTTNGGAAWTAYENLPFNGGYMQFLDDMNGFVLAGEPSGMQKHAVYLYQTSDGGATWTLKYANDPSQPNNTLPFSGHKYGMGFRDTSTGWVGGDYPNNGYFYFYKTVDGGVSWTQQTLPFPAGYQEAFVTVTGPTFFSSTEGILPVRMTIGPDKQDLFLYVTHNGGSTWTPSASFARNGGSVDHVTQRDAFSWNGNNFLATNTTGGSWRTITSNVNFGGSILDYDFVSTTTGWVLDTDLNGHTALYKTTNGGTAWTALYNNIPTQPTADLSITNIRIEYQNTSCLIPGDANGVRVWVTNSGQVAAGSFVVRVNSVDQSINGLGIGETTTLFFPGYTDLVPSLVDATNAVIENNENNNYRLDFLSVSAPPPPCANPIDFAQTVVTTLNAKNFSAAKNLMGQSFGMAFWQSQGNSYPPDDAILQLQSYIGANTVLTSDPNKDLNSLMDGLDPYSIMGLDPSNSLGLFVSGWGPDGKGEAILYVTRNADGSLYWHSVLIAPTGFVQAVPSAPALQGPYAVARVASNEVLNIHSGAGASQPVVGSFPGNAVNVMRTGPTASADNATWVEVQNPSGGTGWVNASYLTEYVTHDAFCTDTRIPVLLEQLKGSMNQSNGDMLATLVSPTNGVNVHLWAYQPANNFTATTARIAFTSTTVYTWGTGPAGGPIPDTGTFAQVIQPKMLEVFNSPNMAVYCDALTNVFPLANPWPYAPNIRYYNLYKPASAGNLDFRTWLIGFEYINNQPYLYGMVTIVWEP